MVVCVVIHLHLHYLLHVHDSSRKKRKTMMFLKKLLSFCFLLTLCFALHTKTQTSGMQGEPVIKVCATSTQKVNVGGVGQNGTVTANDSGLWVYDSRNTCTLWLEACAACRIHITLKSTKNILECSYPSSTCGGGCPHLYIKDPVYHTSFRLKHHHSGGYVFDGFTTTSSRALIYFCHYKDINLAFTFEYSVHRKIEYISGENTKGAVRSPNYEHLGYQQSNPLISEIYTWEISNNDPSGKVTLIFDDWIMCMGCIIEIINGIDTSYLARNQPSTDPRFQRYLYTNITARPAAVSQSNNITVKFTTLNVNNHQGFAFKFTYSFHATDTDWHPILTGGETILRDFISNSRRLYGDESNCTPFIPWRYSNKPKLLDCVWVIQKATLFDRLEVRVNISDILGSSKYDTTTGLFKLEILESRFSDYDVYNSRTLFIYDGRRQNALRAIREQKSDFTWSSRSNYVYVRILIGNPSQNLKSVTKISFVSVADVNPSTQHCSILDTFQCSNSKCVYRSLVCNYNNDCGDRSDEYACNSFGVFRPSTPKPDPFLPQPERRNCRTNEKLCTTLDRVTTCIRHYQICNGVRNCIDNSDEQNCGLVVPSTVSHPYYHDNVYPNRNAMTQEVLKITLPVCCTLLLLVMAITVAFRCINGRWCWKGSGPNMRTPPSYQPQQYLPRSGLRSRSRQRQGHPVSANHSASPPSYPAVISSYGNMAYVGSIPQLPDYDSLEKDPPPYTSQWSLYVVNPGATINSSNISSNNSQRSEPGEGQGHVYPMESRGEVQSHENLQHPGEGQGYQNLREGQGHGCPLGGQGHDGSREGQGHQNPREGQVHESPSMSTSGHHSPTYNLPVSESTSQHSNVRISLSNDGGNLSNENMPPALVRQSLQNLEIINMEGDDYSVIETSV